MFLRVFPFLALTVSGAFAAEAVTPIAAWSPDSTDYGQTLDTSGHGIPGTLHNIALPQKQETLGDPACFRFDAEDAYIEVPDTPVLNPKCFTLTLCFEQASQNRGDQRPLLLKSAPAHVSPWYQYGLFTIDTAEHPRAVAAVVSVGGKLLTAEAQNVLPETGWTHAVAVYDGALLRLYINGALKAEAKGPGGVPDTYTTPLLLGAYGNLPKTSACSFRGGIGPVEIYGCPLSEAEIRAAFEARKAEYPVGASSDPFVGDEYAQTIHDILRQPRDVWGEALIAQGGATYENINDYLRPLFYSTGYKNTELGPHNLLFSLDGGPEPYLVPLANGRRIAANIITSDRYLDFSVGFESEGYGDDLARLRGPTLDGAYYPILQTEYDAKDGIRYGQESFGILFPNLSHIAACIKLTAQAIDEDAAVGLVQIHVGGPAECFRAANDIAPNNGTLEWKPSLEPGTVAECYLLWSPGQPLPEGATIDAARYAELQAQCKAYWDARLADAAAIEAPEPLVMDCMKNLLIQNLMMRWRYSMGAVVYSGSFYQPESNDAMTTLGMYGYRQECLDGIAELNRLDKGEKVHYTNWEYGEKLTHGAHAYFLTRDADAIEKNTPLYEKYCREFVQQMNDDPEGLLRPERQCGDIPEVGYYPFHQSVCWRGMRDMAEVWRIVGREDLHAEFAPVAQQLRANLLAKIAACQRRLPDNSLFIPRVLKPDSECYDPVTETRLGSYWNLVQPYTFDSGLWDPNGAEMDGIVQFMHEHGSMLLGLLRFNYYPVPIGQYRRDGLPGYYTTGFDNVYLPSYLRVIADRDDAERLILSFYGKLAHGQTRNTFVSGEGDNVGPRPSEFYRSSYGSPCSANNAVFLQALRLMLVRESYNQETGLPETLYLAHATPRAWLEDGKRIIVKDAPTCFGPVSYAIESHIAANRIAAQVALPGRNPIATAKLRIRAPLGKTLQSVSINGISHKAFISETGTIDLSGMLGPVEITCDYE